MKAVIRTAVFALALACNSATQLGDVSASGEEHLTARPVATTSTVAPGTYGLLVAVPKDAQLVVPDGASPTAAIPLVVMLHGAGGGQTALDQVIALGQQLGFAVLIPRSRGNTWDLALGGFGPDVVIINKALAETFKKVKVDPARVALAGFSDGASYALSLGTANGDLFTHLIAFAPGFLSAVQRRGKPTIFIAHGREDGVLPFENTQNNIVPFLRGIGYSVRFDPFTGGHRVDPVSADSAFHWLLP